MNQFLLLVEALEASVETQNCQYYYEQDMKVTIRHGHSLTVLLIMTGLCDRPCMQIELQNPAKFGSLNCYESVEKSSYCCIDRDSGQR